MTSGSLDADLARTYAHLYADAVRVLGAWTAPDAGQEGLRRSYADFLASHPDGLAKQGPPQHLTASCVVLDATGERVLLTLHRKARRWFQFGGHLEPTDRTLWHAARREAREESGVPDLEPLPEPVTLDRHALSSRFGHCREHLDVRFAALAPDRAVPAVSSESLDVRWWPVDALPDDAEAELSGLVTRAREVLGVG